MKLFTLCLLVGFAAASSTKLQWQPQKEYHFQYSGRMLSGIPELSTQHSGLGINCTVVLKAKTAHEIHLTIQNPKYVSINGELESVDGTISSSFDWRRLRLPQVQPVPEEQARLMGLPVSFAISPETGDLKEIAVSKKEPAWSVNFKKALIAMLRIKFESGYQQLESNMIASEHPDYWTVEEESLFGKCEASYQVNELPEWFVNERPELFQSCDKRFFEIVKTFDLDKCQKLSSFTSLKLGHPFCSSETGKNCGDASVRTSNTRYMACGDSRHGMTVQSIINDAVFKARMTGTKSEYMVSGTHQMLVLKEVRPISGGLSEIPAPVATLDDLMYEYGMEKSEDGLVDASRPMSMYSLMGWPAAGSKQELERQIESSLIEVAKEMIHSETASESPKIGKTMVSAARAVAMVERKADLVELFEKISSGHCGGASAKVCKTAKTLFLDAAVMAGTPQAVSFLKTMIEESKLSQAEAVYFFMWMPKSVIVPTEQLLEELFQLVTCDAVKRNPIVYGAAISGYAQLVQSACVSAERKYRYPTWTLGEFCSPNSPIVQSKLIPYLARQIVRSAQPDDEIRTFHIAALGLLRHRDVITELTPIVGHSGQAESSTTLERIIAISGLAFGPGASHPSLVVPILSSLFSNPAESTDVRMTSLNALLMMNPPTHVFQAIAAATRQEPTMDLELLKVINVALYTLGHDTASCDPALASKARMAYAAARKSQAAILPSSATWYKTELLSEMGVGYRSVVSWAASQQSVLPKSAFLSLGRFFDRFYEGTTAAGFWTSNGLERIYETVVKGSSSVDSQIKESLGAQWKEIVEKLRLASRKVSPSGSNQGIAYLSVLDSGFLMKSFSERTTQALKEMISSIKKDPSSMLKVGDSQTTVNVQKTFEASRVTSMLPSDMGFPLTVEFRTPVTASLVGKASFRADKTHPSLSVSGRAMLSTHFGCIFGTYLPFTREHLVTGLDIDTVLNVPGTVDLKINVPEHKATVSVRPLSTSASTVLHHEVAPYTTASKAFDVKPFSMTANAKHIKAVASARKQGSYRFGEESLGLSFVAEGEIESARATSGLITPLLENLSGLYNGNPINMAIFGTANSAESGERPSMRRHKIVVRFEPSRSQTKEITAELKFGLATKWAGQPAKYHTVDVKSQSEMVRSSYLPYGIRSQPAASVSGSATHSALSSKIVASLEVLQEVDSAAGITVACNLILKGSGRPMTYSYWATASTGGKSGHGTTTVSQKWNMKLERERGSKVCVDGSLEMPVLPAWNVEELRSANVDFRLFNRIGMGSSSCDEAKVVITGNAKTSHRQKSLSRESPEASECARLVRMGVQGSKLSTACEAVRTQAATLDEVDFKTEFVNVPQWFEMVEQGAVVALKGYLWPYYSFGRSSGAGEAHGKYPTTHQTLTRIAFKQDRPAFDLTLDGPTVGHLVFAGVRVARPLFAVLPLAASRSANSGSSAVRRLLGDDLAPVCVVDSKTVNTFDNRTFAFDVSGNKCSHLIASDCSEGRRSFGVVVRSLGGGLKEVKVMLEKTVVDIVPSSGSGKGPKVVIDGRQVEIPSGKTVKIEGCEQCGTVSRTADGVVVLNAPKMMLSELKTDCRDLSVSPSPMLRNRLCGVCGNIDAPACGPENCVYSKPELILASYLVPTHSCPSVPEQHLKMELLKEKERCAKVKVLPTEVAGSYKASTGKCTVLRHVVLRQGLKEVCVSKLPVTQCGPSCTAPSTSGSMVHKSVPFTCLPAGRLADNYVKKASAGQVLEELKSTETSFTSSIVQPRHCVHTLVPF